jgi:GDP-4-dehydro-6-deoxy-D-mannose reductase
MRALLTGAGGFCGSHLLGYLQSLGVEVHTLGPRVVSPHHHQVVDITSVAHLAEAVTVVRPDYVLHLAGVTVAQEYDLFYRVNTVYAASLLRALEVSGQDHIPVLLVGTAAEYGLISEPELPIVEETPPRPFNHYGISKLGQTLMGCALAKSGRPVIMVRPFNIIGPGMPAHLAIQSFAQQLASIARSNSLPVIEVGNLAASRDFLDVDDVVKIYWQLIQSPDAFGQIINVCSGRATSLDEILSRLISISGVRVKVHVDPARFKPIDIAKHYGESQKLYQLIVRTPATNLESTLLRIWDSVRN